MTKHNLTAVDFPKIVQRFQDLDKVLLTERYVFRQDLKNYEVFEITVWDKKDFGSPNMQHFEIKGK